MLHTTQIKIIEKKKKIPPFFGWSPWEAKTPDPAGSPGQNKKKKCFVNTAKISKASRKTMSGIVECILGCTKKEFFKSKNKKKTWHKKQRENVHRNKWIQILGSKATATNHSHKK